MGKDPGSAEAPVLNISLEDLCSIANKFAEQGRYEDAVELYEKSIKLFPASLALKINLGKTRNLLKEKEEEEKLRMMGKFADERARRDRLSVQVASIGKLFEKKGAEDKAVECYHLSLLHNPSNEQTHLHLAHVHYRANDFSSAAQGAEGRHHHQPLQRRGPRPHGPGPLLPQELQGRPPQHRGRHDPGERRGAPLEPGAPGEVQVPPGQAWPLQQDGAARS